MKKSLHFLYISMMILCFSACIGEDIIDDFVNPVLRIDNPLVSLAVGEEYQFEATYLNNIGQEEEVTLQWESSDPTTISIDASTGLATGVKNGTATISVSLADGGETLVTNSPVAIAEETVLDNPSRAGTIMTTSSYALSGDFVMESVLDQNIIRISVANNYTASSALPGLYLYLTNNPNSINDAYEVGAVTVFNGTHTYEISDTEVALNQYQYLLYWCKPFSVKVGEGRIN